MASPARTDRTPLRILAPALALAWAGMAEAQTPILLSETGDPLGTEQIQDFGHLAVTDRGDWVVIVDTDVAAEETNDNFVVRNGFTVISEGVVVGNPVGATIDEFRSLSTIASGDLGWELLLDLPSGNKTQGLYWNTKLVALQGTPLNTPGYSRSAAWLDFRGFVKINAAGQMLVASEVDDPTIGGISDQSLILLTTDGLGHIVSSIDVAHETGSLPGLPWIVPQNGLNFSPQQFDLNDRGDVVWQTRTSDPQGSTDRVIYLNDQILVQENDPSPIPGVRWGTLQNVRLDLNDRGEVVHEGSLNVSQQNQRQLIAKGNTAIARERQALPAVSPVLINDFGNLTPILLSNAGDVFWRATLTGLAQVDAAFFVNQELLVRKGLTTIEGQTVMEFVDGPDSLAISPSGRYMVFKVVLEDGNTALAFLDLGRVTALDDCGGNVATLRRSKGFAVPGGEVTLEVDGGQAVGVTPILLVSDRTVATYPPCGLLAPFGELVIDLSAPNPLVGKVGNPWGGAPVPFRLSVANNVNLVDQKVWAQAFLVALGGVGGPSVQQIRSTNAVEMEFGAP